MFFEDEDKDQSKNMDDYDLDFEDDKSISWDKLLDEAEAEQLPKKPSEDDLLLEDEESFDSLLQAQDLNIEEEDKSYEDEFLQEDSGGDFEQGLDITGENYEIEPQVADNSDTLPEAEYQYESPVESTPEDIVAFNQEPEPTMSTLDSFNDAIEEPVRQSVPEPSFEPVREEITREEEPPMREKTPIVAPQQKDNAGLWGVLAAVALLVIVGIGGWFYMQNKPTDEAATGDFSALMENNDGQQQSSEQSDFDGQAIEAQNNQPVEPTAQVQQQPVLPGEAPIAPKVVDKSGTSAAKPKVTVAGDKKVTVKIVNTGRVNPFAPAGGINPSKFGFITAPRIDILEPPTELGNLSGDLDRLVKITVSGILYDSVKPSAIINVDNVDYFVQKNDRVDDFTVAAISKDTVVIKKGNNLYRATIGQNFSNGSIAGQVQRLPQRQYVSVSDINVNPQ